MVKDEWQVVQSILNWVKGKNECGELTETDVCCLIEALHFDRLTSAQVESMKHHEILRNNTDALEVLSNRSVNDKTEKNTHVDIKLRSGQQSVKSIIVGIFLSDEFINYSQVPSKALDITAGVGKFFEISSPQVHEDIHSDRYILGVLQASATRPISKPY